jgi:hypothetical protein
MPQDEPLPEREIDALWRKIRQRVPDVKTRRMMSWPKLGVLAHELGYPEIARAWGRDSELWRERSERHAG